MRLLKLLFFFILGLFSSLIMSAEQVYAVNSRESKRIINDSLVQNLSCQSLSVNNIYRSIREDAFDESRNLPRGNWSFRSGMTRIAGCWGLASTQRMVSYLARYNTSSHLPMEQRISTILDMIRGKSLEVAVNYGDEVTYNSKVFEERKLKRYTVFEVEESNLGESFLSGTQSLWNSLESGYHQKFNGTRILRNLENEIEANQVSHFFRPKNIKMGLGNGPRSVRENFATITQLKKNLDGRRLTLLNLRADRTAQHIVMAKSYRVNSNGEIEIKVYDPNVHTVDAILFYDEVSGDFYSPEISYRIAGVRDLSLGVFIVDEDERAPLEEALLEHYRLRCR